MTYPLKHDYVTSGDPWTQATADAAANFANQLYLDRRVVPVISAIKTSAYTAVANDLVRCDANAAAFTVTLPTAPADKTTISILKIDSTANKVTAALGGTDRFFFATSGPTTATVDTQGQVRTFQYLLTDHLWFEISNTVQLAALDSRYVVGGNNSAVVTVKDANFTIQDDGDVTKQAKFQASGITTATTRTYTLPDATGTVVLADNTVSMFNKRMVPRVGSVASSATPTIATDFQDEFDITALAANITSMTTNLSGTPGTGDKFIIRIKDNGTPRTITWGTAFGSSGVATLLATTVANKTHFVGLRYDGSKWICLAVDATGY